MQHEVVEEHAQALFDGIEAAVPGWVERCVERRLLDYRGSPDPEVMSSAEAAGRHARDEVGERLRALLETDIDAQSTTPLTLMRQAVRYPTEVLRAAGVPPMRRDPFAEKSFPDDDYDLAPASLTDVDPELVELGLAWGAAKAMAHRRRHGGGP
jgi:hypothetical protein